MRQIEVILEHIARSADCHKEIQKLSSQRLRQFFVELNEKVTELVRLKQEFIENPVDTGAIE
jgi:tRNA uridine 5-carbamoylmethylation protein Kti12